MKCGVKEKNKRACTYELDEQGNCAVHCRARKKVCRNCERRYSKEEYELTECPDCHTSRWCVKRHLKTRKGCRNHGGPSKRGPSHGRYKEGEHVKGRYKGLLPPGALEEFEATETGEDLLSLRPEIKYLDWRIRRLQAQLYAGEMPDWKDAEKAFNEFAEAQAEKDRDKSIEALTTLSALIRHGAQAERLEEKIDEFAITKRPKLVETEAKLQLARAEVVHKKMVLQLAQTIWAAVERNVKDPKVNTDPDALLGAIETTYLLLIGAGGEAELYSTGGTDKGRGH